MSLPEMAPATIARIASFDWKRVEDDLEAQGYAVLERLLDPAECASVAALLCGGLSQPGRHGALQLR
ncbi:MAG: hypothetical protein R2748_24970 [Bryobacterales bacterium]